MKKQKSAVNTKNLHLRPFTNQHILERLDVISNKLDRILKKEISMTKVVKDLIDTVEALTSADDSLIGVVTALAAKIEESKDDPVELQKLADSLVKEKDKIAAAVLANTPAAPTA